MQRHGHTSRGRQLPIWVLLGLGAMGLTTLLGATTILLQSRYFEHYPYFYDHVYYTYFNLRLHEQLGREGRLQLAVSEWLTNPRHPLRTAPVVLLAPPLLTVQHGHLATSLPCLAAFLWLLGALLHHRTASLPYALAGMALVAALPGLLDPRLGLGAFWLETASAPLLGSAVVCLLLSDGARRLRWLAAFALVAALACLSRYVTVAFVVVLCGPVVAAFLARRYWEERSLWRAVVVPSLVIGAVAGVVAGPFLVLQTRENVLFYSLFGPVGQGKRRALAFVSRTLYGLVGPVGLGAIVLAGGAVCLLAWRQRTLRWGCLILAAWIAGALFATLVLQGSAEALHVVWFVVPPLAIALLAPARIDGAQLRPLAAVLGIVAAGLLAWTIATGWRRAADPPPDVAGQKALDIELAGLLAEQGPGLIWCAYFDEYAPVPTIETFFRHGVLVLPAGQPFFQAHATHWEANYPGLTPETVGRRVAEATTQWVDVAAVYDDPSAADTSRSLNNPYSRAVARIVAEDLRTSSSWRRIATVESREYGRLAVYRNLASNGAGYEQVLRATLRP